MTRQVKLYTLSIPVLILLSFYIFYSSKGTHDIPKESTVYIRTFVLIDSDKKFPSSEEIDQGKKEFLELIKINTTSYHVTLKREIENYLQLATLFLFASFQDC